MKKCKWIGALLVSASGLWVTPSAYAGTPLLTGDFTKAFGAASIPLNGSTSLTFTLTNRTALSALNLVFTDTLPSGVVVSNPNGLASTCAGSVTAIAGSGSVSLSGTSFLGAGSSCSLSVNVTGITPGLKNNISGNLTASGFRGNIPGPSASITVLAALAAAASIPTLSEWGLILLVLAMAASAFKAVRRQR